jgi:hypothetical protein
MHPEEQKPSISESSPDLSSEISLPSKISESDPQQNRDIRLANAKIVSPTSPTQGELFLPKLNKDKLTILESQEKTRAELARFLVQILSRTIIASFSLFIGLLILSIFIDEKKSSSFEKTSSLVKESIMVIFTAQISIVATALGFYFGSKSNQD